MLKTKSTLTFLDMIPITIMSTTARDILVFYGNRNINVQSMTTNSNIKDLVPLIDRTIWDVIG